MTSSARSSSDGGIAMPSAFADFRLTTISNLVGCSTGRSASLPTLSSRSASAKAVIQLRGLATAWKARTSCGSVLLNHVVRAQKQRLGNAQSDRFRGFHVDSKFELG